MARSLNSCYNLKEGFFTCNLPVDMVELVLKVKTRCGKHTLKEDWERRMEKYRPWERWTDNKETSPRCKLDSASPSMTSDSGPWLPTPEVEYRPKLFNDPRNASSDQENMPQLEPIPMPVLNIKESDFLDRTEKLLEKDMKWEVHYAQQIPLPRSSSQCPENGPGSLERLEPEMDDERLANDERPPKPKCGSSLMIQNFFPSPLTCPNYVAVTATAAAAVEPTKPKGSFSRKRRYPEDGQLA